MGTPETSFGSVRGQPVKSSHVSGAPAVYDER
jgi:hypothetical protein